MEHGGYLGQRNHSGGNIMVDLCHFAFAKPTECATRERPLMSTMNLG